MCGAREAFEVSSLDTERRLITINAEGYFAQIRHTENFSNHRCKIATLSSKFLHGQLEKPFGSRESCDWFPLKLEILVALERNSSSQK